MSLWVCNACADKQECLMPEGRVATFHMGACDVCGNSPVEVTEDRDYGRHRQKIISAYEERIKNREVMKAAPKKITKRKPTIKKGLFMRKSVNGISLHIHFGGGNKACALTGYNQPASVQKALLALSRTLNEAYNHETGKFAVTDERKIVKRK